jgi:hypothetical protein
MVSPSQFLERSLRYFLFFANCEPVVSVSLRTRRASCYVSLRTANPWCQLSANPAECYVGWSQ